ncbi:MAG: hypothetical protein JSV09_07215, partial [Thermoplasmata archaeon]
MNAKKILSELICIALISAGFVMVGIKNVTSDYTITREDDPYPNWGDLAVFSGEISVDASLFVGKASTIEIDVHNLGITYAITWHDGDYVEYDFYQSSDQTLDIKIRIRSIGDATDTDVKLDRASIARFNSMPEYDIITIHNVPISTGDHTIRITQMSDSPTQGDDLYIDWLEIGNNRIECEFYNRSDGNDPNKDLRGVDGIQPSDITVKFYVDNILIAENDKIGSHSNSVPGGYPYPEAYFIPNMGSSNTSTSWVPSMPGYHNISIEVKSGIGPDSNLANNRACITIYIGSLQPPTLYLNVSQDGEDVILYWDPPLFYGTDHYLIYRSTSQIDFDFNTIWKNTSSDKEPGEPNPIPLRTMWNDTKAAFPGNDSNYERQYYYIIRAVSILGEKSRTSRTVGKWTKTFPKGVSTFSLPLEPIDTFSADYYTSTMNAEYIKYMNSITHTWAQHNFRDSNTNNSQMKLGEGFEVKLSNQTNYTFTGMPSAMISYDDDNEFLGFDLATEAKDLIVTVEPNGDVNLTWPEPSSMSDGWYGVYYSNKRDGFFGAFNTSYFPVLPSVNFGNNTVTHRNALANESGVRLYYMVIPFNGHCVRGASTYSIGIWTEGYLAQYDTFGIPLKLETKLTADWYCDNIPDTVGMNYYNIDAQRWDWHSTRMPKEAYDPLMEMTKGYQI